MAETARRARVERLVAGARALANPEAEAGRTLRQRLLETTGLSAQGIELALARCLETTPSLAELETLVSSTPEAPRAHVLLSANVFVAALRAIALGLASSENVQVRASRSDPALAEALHDLVPGLFELTTKLSPEPGDHFWSYGADATIAELRRALPAGVWFHQHGAGIGAVVVDAQTWTVADAGAVALDTVLFDQRGCLSPRAVCVLGSSEQARSVAEGIARELGALEREVPIGQSNALELADARRNRDLAAYAFEVFDAGRGWVSVSAELVIAPSGRNLHVVHSADAVQTLAPFVRHITCIGTNARALEGRLRQAFTGARVVALGDMQRPSLDGPVDRRHGTQGELLRRP
jgi:Acyl-CoA reductase (LuxC)